MTNCILCRQDKFKKVGEIAPGVNWLVNLPEKFDVYDCEVCDTRFAHPIAEINYEFVFRQTDEYANHLEIARKLNRQEDPSWALIGLGQPYYAVFDFIKGKKELEILDVGCSYGYLTHTLRLMGHEAIGIDVALLPVQMATAFFGNYFSCFNIENFVKENPDKKYNLVVAVEVLEHLINPMSFIDHSLKALKPDGSLLLTTPNKDFTHVMAGRIEFAHPSWIMEQPPIHTAIYGRKSMEWIAEKTGTILNFTEFPGLAERSGSLNMAAIFTKNKIPIFNVETKKEIVSIR